MYEAVRALVTFVLPGLTAAEVIHIMAARTFERMVIEPEFFELEVLRGCFGEDDQKDVDQVVIREQSQSDSPNRKSLHAHVQRLRRKTRGAGGHGEGSSSIAPRARGRPTFVSEPGEYSQEEAQLFLPEGARLSKDLSNWRWLVVHPPFGTRSRSFNLYGSAKALALVLQWARANEVLRTGEPCPHE